MPLDEARASVADGRWRDAIDALDSLGDEARSAEAWELRAQAAYGNGQLEASIVAWEQVHALRLTARDDAGAAMAAGMIALYLMMDTGMMAPVRGWLRRAEQLGRDLPDAPVHAVVAMVKTYERFMSGDLVGADAEAARAIELGGQMGVEPAVVIGRVAAARIRILAGQVDEGLRQLDELATLLMAGGADPLTTGMMYCELICAAQGLALYERAAEWTEVMERWRHGVAFGGINGRCRVHRAEVLRMSGPCDEAEAEALGACDDLRPWLRREFGWPLVELGNIRLRKGDLAGAEEAFLAAHRHAWTPNPGLALLRLEQGDVSGAASLIAAEIAHPLDIPSKERPPFGDLRLAPLYEAQVQIAVAAGDLRTARCAVEVLRDIAGRFSSRGLSAGASLALARVALLAGDTDDAVGAATEAVMMWTDIGAPYEAAVARLVLAEAYAKCGNVAGGRMERRAARDAFERYGATRWAQRTAALIDNGSPVLVAQRAASVGTFRREGGLRVVTFGGPTVTVRDLLGLRYVERLLTAPGREFHVLDLVAVERGTLPTAGTVDVRTGTGDDDLPIIDEQARAAYRARLAEVDDDIAEATERNDLGRIDRAQLDREYLISELSRAVGLGGRLRSSGSSTERRRTSVARSIRYSLGQLARHHPMAATHLARAVRTGTYCVYESDPMMPITWETRTADRRCG